MEIEKEIFDDVEDALPEEFAHMSAEGVSQRARLIENELRVLRDESTRLSLEQNNLKEKIKENKVRRCSLRGASMARMQLVPHSSRPARLTGLMRA